MAPQKRKVRSQLKTNEAEPLLKRVRTARSSVRHETRISSSRDPKQSETQSQAKFAEVISDADLACKDGDELDLSIVRSKQVSPSHHQHLLAY